MSIQFSCPQCGTTTSVDESFAGQTGPCANCGATVTIPGSSRSPQKTGGSGPTLVIILVVCAAMCIPCGAIGVALLLPAVQASREAARRMSCSNNLKQIGIAMHNYHDTWKTFPPAFIPDENGQPKHSWRVLILPFMEQQGMYSMYDFDEAWDGPNNQGVGMTMPDTFRCPSDPSGNCAYHVISVPGGVFDGPNASRIASITDGTANTILVVESVGSTGHWLDPNNNLGPAALSSPVNAARNGTTISSYHSGGAMIVRADGSTVFLTDFEAATMIDALVKKSDNQAIPGF